MVETKPATAADVDLTIVRPAAAAPSSRLERVALIAGAVASSSGMIRRGARHRQGIKRTIPPWRHRPAAAAPARRRVRVGLLAADLAREVGERGRAGAPGSAVSIGAVGEDPLPARARRRGGRHDRSLRTPELQRSPPNWIARAESEREAGRGSFSQQYQWLKRNRRQPPTSTSPSFGHSRRAVQSARAGRSDRGRRGLQLGHDPARRSAPPRDKENHPAMATSASSRSAGQAAGAGRSAGGGFGARSGRERTRRGTLAVRFRPGLLAKTPYQRAPGAAAAGMIVRSERPSSSVRPRTGLPRGIRERSGTRLVLPAISMVETKPATAADVDLTIVRPQPPRRPVGSSGSL